MKARLINFIKKSMNPLALENSWNTQQMDVPSPKAPGQPATSPEPGPSAASLDSFAQDIDMPEELSVSPLMGNPASPQPANLGSPDFGNSFKEKLRRRRSKDYTTPERGGLTYG